jgi:GntR family transcriptional regulator/MocR family aminotransferase
MRVTDDRSLPFKVLTAEVRKNLRGMLEVAPAETGMHLIGWLPHGIDDRDVSRRAAEANLKIAPVSAYCIDQILRGGLLLGYTAFNEKLIKQGVKKSGCVLNEFI